MEILDEIEAISISHSIGYGGVNSDFFAEVTEADDIQLFKTAMVEAERAEGIAEDFQAMPDYDLLIEYENGETHLLNVLLGDVHEPMALVYVGHEHNVFFVQQGESEALLAEGWF
ncbi:hypothetical protein [Salsuginibacillus kocurii]|uniref:hypothetical protein n=1 Tax=Salsuginibacillus kocurii TaxID=427078 RepID=UPI00036A05FB|nr:hypothetical protein [Salsuginibacillus kocurii]